MKIWGERPRISGIYDKHKNIKKYEQASSVSSKQDKVSISNKAKDFQSVMKALKDVPDVRKDKIDELSKKYESGNYSVSGREIVDKIITSSGENKIDI